MMNFLTPNDDVLRYVTYSNMGLFFAKIPITVIYYSQHNARTHARTQSQRFFFTPPKPSAKRELVSHAVSDPPLARKLHIHLYTSIEGFRWTDETTS